MRILISLCLALLSFQLAFSQNFIDGYVISSKQDTTYGLVFEKNDPRTPGVCRFKQDADASAQELTASDIAAFRYVNGKYFVSREITIGDKKERVFVEYLVNGIVDIYYYKNERGEFFFLDEGDGDLKELTSEERKIYKDNEAYSFTNKRYVGVLKNAFAESPDLQKKAENVSLGRKSLINITRDYHEAVCTSGEPCLVYERTFSNAVLEIGLVAGYNTGVVRPNIERRIEEFFFIENHDLDRNYFPSFGISVARNFPEVDRRLWVQYEALFSQRDYKVEGISRRTAIIQQNDVEINLTSINNVLTVRYDIYKGILVPEIGFFYDAMLDTEYSSRLINYFHDGSPIEGEYWKEQAPKALTPHYGGSLGIGYKRKFSVTARYQFGIIGRYYLNEQHISFNISVPLWRIALKS